jgi:hypothetical protein
MKTGLESLLPLLKNEVVANPYMRGWYIVCASVFQTDEGS